MGVVAHSDLRAVTALLQLLALEMSHQLSKQAHHADVASLNVRSNSLSAAEVPVCTSIAQSCAVAALCGRLLSRLSCLFLLRIACVF